MSDSHTEVVYTPESQLSSPCRLVRAMCHDLVASRELAWCLMVRDISARYRQSLLGILWAFLPPVLTAALFILLNRSAVIAVGETNVAYPAFVMFGFVSQMPLEVGLTRTIEWFRSSAHAGR